MNYPEIELNGVGYPYLNGMGALRKFARDKRTDVVKSGDLLLMLASLTLDEQDYLAYCCLFCGCKVSKVDFPFTFEDFQEYLIDNPHVYDLIQQANDEQLPASKEGKTMPVNL